jgi:hypothetical protein
MVDEAETRRQLPGKNRGGGGRKYDRPAGGFFRGSPAPPRSDAA